MFAVPENTVAAAAATAPQHPVRVAMAYAANRDAWRHLLRYDPTERFATLVERTDETEIWLMSWLPGQETALHDHGDTSGAFTVVSGGLTETVARRRVTDRATGEELFAHELTAGQSRVFAPGYVHQVRNTGSDPAVSIHVYRYGSRTMRNYHRDPEGGVVRD